MPFGPEVYSRYLARSLRSLDRMVKMSVKPHHDRRNESQSFDFVARGSAPYILLYKRWVTFVNIANSFRSLDPSTWLEQLCIVLLSVHFFPEIV